MPVSNCQPGEDDSQALGRALRWQAPGFWPWRCLAGSVLFHALLLLPFTSVALSLRAPAPESDSLRRSTVMPLFAPRSAGSPSPSRITVLRPPSGVSLSLPPPDFPDVKVDLNAILLSFAPDIRNELPQVVQDQHGMLALLDKEDKTVARYLVRPPAWETEEKIQDVSRSLRILMDPPEKWAVLRNVSQAYGIDLNQYQACAVFDLSFRACLKNAILAKAFSAPAHSGSVKSARLAIAAGQPCGIEVLEVSFAAR